MRAAECTGAHRLIKVAHYVAEDSFKRLLVVALKYLTYNEITELLW